MKTHHTETDGSCKQRKQKSKEFRNARNQATATELKAHLAVVISGLDVARK